MLRIRLLVSLVVIMFGGSPAFATNGDTMISVGSQNTALGGTGVAHFVGAEGTFANPAILGKSTGKEVTGGLVLFKPDVTNTGFTVTTPANSTANTNYIPDVSFSDRISDTLTYGVAIAGIAGMGVNYTDASPAYVKAKTTLSILKVVPTIAYNKDDYGLGFSPVLQYGSLAISYDTTGNPGGGPRNPNHDADKDTKFGYTLGGYYNINPALTVAAAYNSAIKMSYGQQLSLAGKGFGQTFADKLDQPTEIKAGFAYTIANNYTVTADYRSIEWARADGYKQFGWNNQTVISVGGKYAAEGYWVGLGYNSSDNPIQNLQDGTLTPSGNNAGIVNMFNSLMFPAIIKSAYTFGGGYSISKELAIEASGMIAPKVTTKVDISDAQGLAPGSLYNTTTHSQQSYTVSLRYKF